MKIDAVLARHPWPWTRHILFGHVTDANGVFIDGNYTADAILELVEAHVAAAGRESEARKEGKEQ